MKFGHGTGVFSMLGHLEISSIGNPGISGNSEKWQQEKPSPIFPLGAPCIRKRAGKLVHFGWSELPQSRQDPTCKECG